VLLHWSSFLASNIVSCVLCFNEVQIYKIYSTLKEKIKYFLVAHLILFLHLHRVKGIDG
jgi:hypothetical protein